jgi:hypothetical protein
MLGNACCWSAFCRPSSKIGGLASPFATGTVLNRFKDIAIPHQKARRQAEADLYGFIEEQLNGMEDIRSSGAVGFSIRELFRLQVQILTHIRRAHFKRWLVENAMGLALTTGSLLAFGSGFWLFQLGAVTLGTVYLFINYMTMLEDPLWALTHEIESFQTIGACVERLAEFRKIQPALSDGPGADLPANALALRLMTLPSLQRRRPRCALFRRGPAQCWPARWHRRRQDHLGRLIFRLYDPTAGRMPGRRRLVHRPPGRCRKSPSSPRSQPSAPWCDN